MKTQMSLLLVLSWLRLQSWPRFRETMALRERYPFTRIGPKSNRQLCCISVERG
jgi:hypothetical protein